MAIAHVFQHHFKHIVVMGLITLLVACGGGGSSNKDTTPDAFTITPVTGANLSTEVTSTVINVAGINKATAISITGGSYSIDDGAFITAANTVTSGQKIKVKVTSSATTNTPVVATLTIGGVARTFTVITAPDTTPNAFTFTALTGAVISSVNISNTVTVSGFDVPVAISIVGGEYKIDSGAFINTPSTISSGQTVTVRATAATAVSTAVNAVLTIGGVAGTYSVTTLADTVAPTAQIMFPPAVSLSNGTTLKVRGTAHDDYSSITSVTVNGAAAVSTDNYATWIADVPLNTGANTLTVVTTDSASNSNSDAAHVSVQRVTTLTGAHIPDANTPFTYASFFTIDSINNRALVVDSGLNAIIAVDLNTGIRTVVSSSVIPNANIPFSHPQGIALDSINNRALVTDNFLHAVVGVDLITGIRTIVSDATTPNANNSLISPYGITFDIDPPNNRNRALLADSGMHAIVAVDLLTGARTILSDPITPNTNIPYSYPYSITLDNSHSKALVVDSDLNAIIAVNLNTGIGSILSSPTIPDSSNAFTNTHSLALDNSHNRILVTDWNQNAIISVDATSGARTIISNPNIPNANNLLKNPDDIKIDADRNIAFVISYPASLFSVDLVTGERVIISK